MGDNLSNTLVNVKPWQDKAVTNPSSGGAGQTVPALVQALAQSGTERLRADFAAQGMAGLRPLHAVLLVPLLGGGRHASDLAETLGVSRQAVAQVVTRLEQDGYLTRITDPGDARAKLICLTPRGRAALRAMRVTALAVEEEWRERLGAERLARFRETLLTLLSALPFRGCRRYPFVRRCPPQRLVPSAGTPPGAREARPVPAAAGTSSPSV
jgi:DNA-binding MarR family transcriptional regulator